MSANATSIGSLNNKSREEFQLPDIGSTRKALPCDRLCGFLMELSTQLVPAYA
jgi:hypothetical protein